MKVQVKTHADSSTIFGGITLLPSKEDVDWDGCSFRDGVAKLKNLAGTKYRTNWKWAGDLDPDECDIYVKVQGKEYQFTGPTAVEKLLGLAKKLNITTGASMKITLGKVALALNPKVQSVIKILMRYQPGLVKKLQAVGTYEGLQHIAGLNRNLVLKTVKDAAKRGVFNHDGKEASWAHSEFFDTFDLKNDESWAEFLLALVLDPYNETEKAQIYERLLTYKFKGQASVVAPGKVATAFFGKIRHELRKRAIRDKVRQGGLKETKMEMRPSAQKQHRMDKNNPWGLNVGYSAAKRTQAAMDPWAVEMGKTITSVVPKINLGLGGMASEDGVYVKEADMRRILAALNKAGYKSRTRSDKVIEVASKLKGCGLYMSPGDADTDSVGMYCLNWYAPTEVVSTKTEAAGEFPNVEQLLARAGCTEVEVKNAGKVFQLSFVAPSGPGKQLYIAATPEANAFQLKVMQAFKKDGVVLKWSGLNLRKASVSMIFARP